MNHRRREWIMIRETILSRSDKEQELESLHIQICCQEELEKLSQVLEIVDLNKYKVVRQSGLVKKYILSRDKKRFCFMLFKN